MEKIICVVFNFLIPILSLALFILMVCAKKPGHNWNGTVGIVMLLSQWLMFVAIIFITYFYSVFVAHFAVNIHHS